MFVPDLIEKGFYKLARLFGVNIEDGKTAGKVGLGLFAIFCAVMAIIHLPALIGGLGAAFGVYLRLCVVFVFSCFGYVVCVFLC